jgi:hypothetical protein
VGSALRRARLDIFATPRRRGSYVALFAGALLLGGCGRTQMWVPCAGDSCQALCNGPGCADAGPAPATCSSSADCPEQYLCAAGECRLEAGDCRTGQACPSGTHCFQGTCLADRCTSNAECADGSVCDNGSCVPVLCDRGQPCMPGEECISGRCVPGARVCSSGAQCPTGSWCIDGTCQQINQPCQASRECPSAEACVAGQCVPLGQECSASAPCAPGARCQDGRCIPDLPGCGVGGPCPPGFECSGSECCGMSLCVPPPVPCGTEVAYCPAQAECVSNECCLPDSQTCWAPTPTCEQTIDCPQGMWCALGICMGRTGGGG